jgi:hypothetical protein
MGEVGCLKDGNFQNVEVNGNLRVGNVDHRWVVGYAPSTFVGLTNGAIKNFNTSPGMGEKTTAATGALILPMGSTILRAFLINPTSVSITTTTSFDIGVHAASATTDDSIFDACLIATVNAGAQVWGGMNANTGSDADTAFSGFGTVGATIATAAQADNVIGSVTTAAHNFVTFTNNGATVAGAGADMRIYIEYINFEEKL